MYQKSTYLLKIQIKVGTRSYLLEIVKPITLFVIDQGHFLIAGLLTSISIQQSYLIATLNKISQTFCPIKKLSFQLPSTQKNVTTWKKQQGRLRCCLILPRCHPITLWSLTRSTSTTSSMSLTTSNFLTLSLLPFPQVDT